MNICVIGAGYVGLTSAAVIANLGHRVLCVDTNREKIASLQKGKVPIYEPNLQEMIEANQHRLTFSTNIPEAINNTTVLLIAVGTPSQPDGKTDLTYINAVVDTIAQNISTHKTIITKSTVPPGTNEEIYSNLVKQGVDPTQFEVVSNPEFLREGSALYDMQYPDKIVVGLREDDTYSLSVIEELYQGLKAPYVVTNWSGAEMIKYTSNAFLATKISFINEISRICDKFNADIKDVVKGIGSDPRIGPHFLQSGIGYGGSCFPKDVLSLEHSALSKNVTPLILQAVQQTNRTQVDVYIDKLKGLLTNLDGKRITVLGIAFKPNTDDTRYSPAVELIKKLSELGCVVSTYDPKASLPFPTNEKIIQHNKLEKAFVHSDAVFIATDWDEFLELDWDTIRQEMNGNILFDGRNCLNPSIVKQQGMNYVGVGRI